MGNKVGLGEEVYKHDSFSNNGDIVVHILKLSILEERIFLNKHTLYAVAYTSSIFLDVQTHEILQVANNWLWVDKES